MFESIKPYMEKIDERILRERVLIFFSAIAVIYLLWSVAIQSSISKKIALANTSIIALANQKTTTQTEIAAATQMLLSDPNVIKKEQITQLQNDISSVETQLHAASESLIRAEQLPEALQQVLQKTASLHLVEVKTLPAKELQLAQSLGEIAAETVSKELKTNTIPAGVYQHSVVLKVSGSYFQILDFLMALEQLPCRFYWQSLDYKVMQYPTAEIILQVYTLSSEEGLFGV